MGLLRRETRRRNGPRPYESREIAIVVVWSNDESAAEGKWKKISNDGVVGCESGRSDAVL